MRTSSVAGTPGEPCINCDEPLDTYGLCAVCNPPPPLGVIDGFTEVSHEDRHLIIQVRDADAPAPRAIEQKQGDDR